jgi:hypothetical protein
MQTLRGIDPDANLSITPFVDLTEKSVGWIVRLGALLFESLVESRWSLPSSVYMA